MRNNNINVYGLLGLLASIMVGIGEFLIHFNGDYDPSIPYGYFIGIPQQRFITGHFLLIPFIPFYFLGYWHLYLALKSGSKNLAITLFALGVFAFTIGGIWVGSRAYLGATIQVLNDANASNLQTQIIASYDLYMESLINILRVIILFISIIFIWTILKGRTLYPKWMVFFNPMLLLLIVFGLYFFVRPIGQYLAPTAINVAHFALFSASLFALKNNNKSLKQ